MAKTDWFTHTDLTAAEADQLIGQYTKRGITARKFLAPDCRKFNVQALLPVTDYAPRPSKIYQSKLWR